MLFPALGGFFATSGLALAGCLPANAGMRSMHGESITLLDRFNGQVTIRTLVADDAYERSQGFQHVCGRTIDTITILFAYTHPTAALFHMSNVQQALDIGFFDDQGVLIRIMTMKPYTGQSRPLYGPGQPFQYALEARMGFFDESGLSEGISRLVLDSLGDGR